VDVRVVGIESWMVAVKNITGICRTIYTANVTGGYTSIYIAI
jgi:hypothetical protein